MAVLSYNLSPKISGHLKNIDLLRQKILTTPISPKNELRLRWEANLQKLYWSLVLSGNNLSKTDMITLIAFQWEDKLTVPQKEVVNYKKSLDYIRENWWVNPKPVTSSVIMKLYDLSCKATTPPSVNSFKAAKTDIDKFLEYLNTGSEHPILQAAIAQIHILGIAPFASGNGRVSRLLTYLYLYKTGYDVHEQLVFDDHLRSDLLALREAVESVRRYKTLTLWFEYFTEGVEKNLIKVYEDLSSPQFKTHLTQSFWKLNERQKKVLNILEQPGERITTKKVVELFKISPITASRDLSKMEKLGILFVHGKGRAVYYTRA
jgi:Fic family protein